MISSTTSANTFREMDSGSSHVSDSLPLKVFLIGPRGAGKSATINTILGEKVAPSTSGLSSESTTKDITEYHVKDLNITLVDTPALRKPVTKKIHRALAGNDIIGFVIPAQRMQVEVISSIGLFLKHLRHFHKRSFIIITKGKNYNAEGVFNWKAIEELYNIYTAVERRIAVFENNFETQRQQKDQIEKLLYIVNKCKANETSLLPPSTDKLVKIKSAIAVACFEEGGNIIVHTVINIIERSCYDILESLTKNVLQKTIFSIAPTVFELSSYNSILWIYF
ncbi:GTPase IMAP family member 9-like [Saccostrea cucullata]|uniref:GTPase IMAP family member 9-like n=1 Tax=Saccostrea cuccullata TaxID=36930 RepID=UPI002ED67326